MSKQFRDRLCSAQPASYESPTVPCACAHYPEYGNTTLVNVCSANASWYRADAQSLCIDLAAGFKRYDDSLPKLSEGQRNPSLIAG